MKLLDSAKKIFCIAALLCIGAWTANANLVVNGGFETGDFTGWTVNDPSNFSGVGNDPGLAHSGNHYAFLGATPNTGMLSQTQNLMTTAGTFYTLSFWLANDITSQLPPGTTSFEALWNGAPVFNISNPAAFDYTLFSFSVQATGPSTVLEFDYRHDNDFWRLDDVSVNVPDSGSTIWLALPIFAGLGLLNYRFRVAQGLARA
jgi:hypothetical protein